MTLKELCERLNISRPVALRLVKKIPGARKEAAGAGKIPQWVIPDDAAEVVDADLLAEARAEAASLVRPSDDDEPVAAPSSWNMRDLDPALRDEQLAVQREKLAAERIRAETSRLEAEASRAKVERELQSLHGAPAGTDAVLADRLVHLGHAIEELARRPLPDSSATITELVKSVTPMLTPLIERFSTSASPSPSPALGITDLLTVAEKLKGFAAPADSDLRRAIRDAFRDGIELGREHVVAEGATRSGEEPAWAGFWQGLAPFLPELVDGLRGLTGPAPRATSALTNPNRSNSQEGGPATMDPAAEMFQEILDALVVELSKSKETRDIAGISSFLESVPVNAEGDTLLDRFAPLARTPEALAKLSIKLIDPRLTTAPAWAGVMDLLAHVRDTETTTGGR